MLSGITTTQTLVPRDLFYLQVLRRLVGSSVHSEWHLSAPDTPRLLRLMALLLLFPPTFHTERPYNLLSKLDTLFRVLFAMLGIKSRLSHMFSKHSTTEQDSPIPRAAINGSGTTNETKTFSVSESNLNMYQVPQNSVFLGFLVCSPCYHHPHIVL